MTFQVASEVTYHRNFSLKWHHRLGPDALWMGTQMIEAKPQTAGQLRCLD